MLREVLTIAGFLIIRIFRVKCKIFFSKSFLILCQLRGMTMKLIFALKLYTIKNEKIINSCAFSIYVRGIL